MKKILTILILIVAAIGAIWVFLGAPDPIEDTNGPDNHNLQVINDFNIINQDMGMTGGVKVHEDVIGDGITISSDGFTGVYEILWNNYLGQSDIVLEITGLTVTEGNFKAALLLDDEIVEVIPFNQDDPFYTFRLEDVNGAFSFRIAGESAAFSFSILNSHYDEFEHP